MSSEIGLPELQRARRASISLLFAVFVFSVFVNLLMLTGPLFMLQVYDRVLSSGSEETLVALFLLVCILYMLMGVLDYARGRVLARFGARFQTALDDRVFDAVIKRSSGPNHDGAFPVSGLQYLETIRTIFTSPEMLVLFDVPWTPIFITAIFVFHPMLGWIALLGGVFLIGITLLNIWLTCAKINGAQMASASAQGFANQARYYSELVRSQGMSRQIRERWQNMRGAALEQILNVSDWTGVFTSLSKLFRLFLQSAMLAVGAWLVLTNELTPGAMIAASILLGRALAPIEQSIGQWRLVQHSVVGWKALGDLLKNTPPDRETMTLPQPEARLVVRGVSVYARNTTKPTLSNISFELPPGQALGIIGKSGSGKSTLAKVLVGLVPPVFGSVRLGGGRLDQYPPDDLGQIIGYLPQEVTFFTGTIAENIARMSSEPDESKIIKAAKRSNAHEMILSLRDGYQTSIGEQGCQLSGAQKQRVALARAFYNDPVLLVLDEPNSCLDADGSASLNNAIREFKMAGNSAIIMTHRPTAIAECDFLIVIEGGEIKAKGQRDHILRSMLRNAEDIQQHISRGQRV